MIAIKIKEVPIKVYNSIGKVEKYYIPLCWTYKIIYNKLNSKQIDKEIILQIAIKAVSNLAGLDGIVPILLIFRAYLRITKIDFLLLLIV